MQGEASTRLGFTELLPRGTRVGQAPRGGAVARAGAGASEGVGIRRLFMRGGEHRCCSKRDQHLHLLVSSPLRPEPGVDVANSFGPEIGERIAPGFQRSVSAIDYEE